jgi:hypothetical protein
MLPECPTLLEFEVSAEDRNDETIHKVLHMVAWVFLTRNIHFFFNVDRVLLRFQDREISPYTADFQLP